jgi:hypothetical protein
MRMAYLLLVLSVVAVAGACSKAETVAATPPATTSVPTTISAVTEDQVAAEVEKLGGKVAREHDAADGAIATISFNDHSEAITDALVEHFRGLTKLTHLYLSGTSVTDAGLQHLSALTELRVLYLSRTKVTDAGLEHLKNLNQLEILKMGFTEVTDAGLVHLKGMTKLQMLDLTKTKITDAGLENLTGFNELQWLDLMIDDVSDEGITRLQKALPKCHINH